MEDLDKRKTRLIKKAMTLISPDPVGGAPDKNNKATHGGPAGRVIQCVIVGHPDFLDLTRKPKTHQFIEVGANMGTATLLAANLGPTRNCHALENCKERLIALRQTNQKLIETRDLQGFQVHDCDLNNADCCPPIRASMSTPTLFYMNNAEGLFLNSGLQSRMEDTFFEYCAVDSVVVCFDVMFGDKPFWKEERFIISVPTADLPWRGDQGSHDTSTEMKDQAVFRYTKTKLKQFTGRLRMGRNAFTKRIDYLEYTRIHDLDKILNQE